MASGKAGAFRADGSVDVLALTTWMERLEQLATIHAKQQVEMHEALKSLSGNAVSNAVSNAGSWSITAGPARSTFVSASGNDSGSPGAEENGPWSQAPNASPPKNSPDVSPPKRRQSAVTLERQATEVFVEPGAKNIIMMNAKEKLKNLVKPQNKGLSMKQVKRSARETACVEGFIESRAFEVFSLALVLSNALVLGWELQYFSANHMDAPTTGFFEVVFGVLFTAELLVRVVPVGPKAFKSSWVIFDTMVVSSMLFEHLLNAFDDSDSSDGRDLLGQIPVLRMLRVIRLVRVLRIIRVVKFFRELRLMVMSIIACMRSLCWAGIVMIFIFYVFGISLTQGFVDHCMKNGWCMDEPKLLKHFGSVDATMLSLYEAMTGGISWGELLDLIRPFGAMYILIFLAYINISILAVLNVVTGLFVENAMQTSKADAEALIQEEMQDNMNLASNIKAIFDAMDTDNSGSIGMDEFYEALDDDRMVAFFNAMRLSIGEVDTLFMLLDQDKKGTVSYDEFLNGFMNLKGGAMSLDVHKVMAQCDNILHILMHSREVTVVDEYIEEVKENALHHMSADSPDPEASAAVTSPTHPFGHATSARSGNSELLVSM